jgi:hypothetical protein
MKIKKSKTKRKPRRDLLKAGVDLLEKPLDIDVIGTNDDPCFGKLHDLKNETCSRCGDSEFCAIVFSQNLHLKRDKIESKQEFMDLEEAKDIKHMDEVKDFITNTKKLGKSEIVTIIKTRKLYPEVPKEFIKEYYKSL